MRLTRHSLLFSVLLIALVTRSSSSQHAVPPTQPATTQLSPEEEARRERAALDAEVRELPTRRVDTVRDILRFKKQDDRLRAECILNDLEQHTFNRLVVADLPGVVTLRSGGPDPVGDEPHDFMFLQRDLTKPGAPMIQTTVSSVAGRLTIAREQESEKMFSSVQLIQDPAVPDPDPAEPPVRLYIAQDNKLTQQRQVDLKLNAMSFAQLYLQHPREVDQYLRPVLRDLRQEAAVYSPDTKAAWQVLAADATVDPQAAARVQQILSKLDAPNFQEREGAMAALQDMGQPAALVLMRTDRSKLSPDKQSGVDSFLAPFLPLSADDARRLGNDKTFLLNVLSADDPQLRKLAWARLQKLASPSVTFDPVADDATRATQLSKLRDALLEGSSPTTQENR
jgi:hypothetical protein